MKSTLLARAVVVVLPGLSACGGDHSPTSAPAAAPAPATAEATRSWRLGFAATPPRFTTAAVLQGIDLWSQRAALAAIHEELPWTDLLNGMSPDAILDRDKGPARRLHAWQRACNCISWPI